MKQRIIGFDLARAYAIFGMFIVNFNMVFGSYNDQSIIGKFMSLFSGNSSTVFVILAGMAYRQYLEPHMKNVEVPFEGLRIGQQKKALLQKLKEAIIKLTTKIIKEVKKLYKNGIL